MSGTALERRNERGAGLGDEIRVAWGRTWGGRLLPMLVAGVALLVVLQRLVTPAPAVAVHGELGRLATVNETIGFALMVGALFSAYRLLSPDLSSEFESMSSRGTSGPLMFMAGRLVVALPLLMLAMVLTCAFGRIVGVIASVVMLNLGADAAYQRAALADGFIAPSGLYSIEQAVAWLLPRP